MDGVTGGAATVAAMLLGLALAVGAPVLLWARLSNPERAREHWLIANAHPGWTVAGYSFSALVAIGTGVTATLIAVYKFPFMWTVTALAISALASLAISIHGSIGPIPPGEDVNE
ncbi:hypothetical protein E6C70_09675 [Glaciibacter flavus]|uniref:Uncharacterized protein n=1 Tax=Orlajensenia flava TaxID=2565934 RepID=A0A4S4FVH6_9MICO|nr:hypothetical protein [Glaciibacter flavus]THG34514.1 hypothetical protein E6C70_09675 [Glaciibacter flavus]